MGQTSQLLRAAAPYSNGLHGLLHPSHNGAERRYDTRDDLAFRSLEIQGAASSKEGKAIHSVAQVLDLRKAGNKDIGHGDWFRENGIHKHFLAPRSGIVATSCCVPTTQSMTAKTRRASGNSYCYTIVNGYGEQTVNSVHVPKRHSKFVAASPSQAVANACAAPSQTAPAPLQTRSPSHGAADGQRGIPSFEAGGAKMEGRLTASPDRADTASDHMNTNSERAVAPIHSTSAWSAS